MSEVKTKRKMPQKVAAEKRRAIEIQEREDRAFRLWRFEKKSYRAIGDELGISHTQAADDINGALARIADEFEDEVRVWKTKQLRRLVGQYDRFDAIAADEGLPVRDRINAGKACLGFLKEINDLVGIKAAIKHEVSSTTDISAIKSAVIQRLKDEGYSDELAVEQAEALYPEVSNVSNAIN